jgi:CheY-like chemotaxis protein
MSPTRRVLVVDDSPKLRRTMREILEEAGARVEECTDGDEVLDAFERFVPDIVLMDVRMARLDGLAATRLLKEKHPEARVVIVTEIDQPDLRLGAREAGA